MGQNYTNELEWKNHNKFFDQLNDKIEKMSELAEESTINSEKLNQLYSLLYVNLNRYSVYLDKEKENYFSELENVKNKITTNAYITAIRGFNRLSNQKKIELSKIQEIAFIKLNKCLSYFVQQMALNELLPKVKRKRVLDPSNAVLDSSY